MLRAFRRVMRLPEHLQLSYGQRNHESAFGRIGDGDILTAPGLAASCSDLETARTKRHGREGA